MAEVIGESGVRVRFAWTRRGAAQAGSAAEHLARGLAALDAAGLCPTLDDGLAAGNAAVRDAQGIWVSPSGRKPTGQEKSEKALNASAMVHVAEFSAERWAAVGDGPQLAKPTSDTPLHWAALVDAAHRFGWASAPNVALHGHALEDGALAQQLGIPVSPVETLFSTPDDRAALLELLGAHPYPDTKVWVRRGHGFFLLADDMDAALGELDALRARLTAR